MTTPRTCPHCSEPVEAGHSFCGSCGNDLPEPDCSICGKPRQWNGPYEMPHWCGTPPAAIDTSAPLSLLGENPQVYGSMGAYCREPIEPIDRSKYPTLLSDPRVKQREAPGTPIDRLASVGDDLRPELIMRCPSCKGSGKEAQTGYRPLSEDNERCPRCQGSGWIDKPQGPPAPASPVIEHTPTYPMHRDCPDPAKCPCECEMCMGGPVYDIAAAQQSVLEAAKAWHGADGSANASDRLVEALEALAEAETTK